MSYSSAINKLSYETKKALDDTNNIQRELQKHKYAFKKITDNSMGYKIKYSILIDNDIRNNIYLTGLEIIVSYILETIIHQNDIFFQYNFYVYKGTLRLSIFHSDKEYLELCSENIEEIIQKHIVHMSQNIRNKFLEIHSTPLRIKLKNLQKDYPVLIDLICNILSAKKLLEKTEDIVDSVIKLFFINDIDINKDSEIFYTTYKSTEDPIEFLGQLYENSEQNLRKKFKTEEKTNSSAQQLFWKTLEKQDNSTPVYKNYFMHSIIFILLLALIYYKVPPYLQKLIDFSKNNSVIDNILDIATDDLTTTATAAKTTNFTKGFQKMDTINEYTTNEPNEPNDPAEPSESSDDISIITRNIIKNFSNSSNDLDGIEKRLKFILEETS